MPLPLRYTGLIRLEEPLSALDTHVGEAVFNNVLLHSSSGSTRILVTHALHFLPRVEYIYFIVDGRIAERGTFDEMMANRGDFAHTLDEFVTLRRNSKNPREKMPPILKTSASTRMSRSGKMRSAVRSSCRQRNATSEL